MSLNFKTVDESKITISQLMLPSHSNFNGKIHGGYILSLMDQIAFACASKYSGAYCVTASVDTVDFLNPIEIGELVTLKASVNYVGKTSMVIGIRVDSENIQNGKSKTLQFFLFYHGCQRQRRKFGSCSGFNTF
jgi:uncharacterized protein (TIGR00369 family)